MKRLFLIWILLLPIACTRPEATPDNPSVGERFRFDLSTLDFQESGIYTLSDLNGNPLSIVTREYLGKTYGVQALLVYPKGAGESFRQDSIFVARLLAADSAYGQARLEEAVHGGSLYFDESESAFFYHDVNKTREEPATEIELTRHKDSHISLSRTISAQASAEVVATPMLLSLDDHDYPLVKIAGSIWTAENLRCRHYADGAAIPQSGTWSQATANWSESPNPEAGFLYNAYTTSRLAPAGWRVPSAGTDSDWAALASFAGSTANLLSEKNNLSGLSIVPAGRVSPSGEISIPKNDDILLWSSTEASDSRQCFTKIFYSSPEDKIQYTASTDKRTGMSVRLIKDFQL